MIRKVLIILSFVFLSGCGSATEFSEEEKPGAKKELPSHFSGVFQNPTGSLDCQSPLLDPDDQTELILIRSLDGIGAYQAPPGKYDLAADELLRINCRTGEVLGVEKK